jgi:hypothetical protein
MATLEPTGVGQQADVETVSFISKRYDDKNWEFERRQTVREYLSKFIQNLLGSESDQGTNGYGRNTTDSRSTLYTSNLALKGFEFATTAKLDPDQVDFATTQETPEEQQDTADNYTSLVKYTQANGGYQKMVHDCRPDLVFGECWRIQEYQKQGDRIIKPQYKHIPWEQVRGYYGETDLITIENLTVGQFVLEYGEEMLKKVQYGYPINVNNEFEDTTNDDDEVRNKDDKRIGIVKYYDPALKKHNVLIGGGAYMPPEMQMDGDDYFWVDDDGDAFCSVNNRVYRRPIRGYHGYGILDTLWVLAYLETVITNASSHAAVLASDPMLIFYADDIAEMENRWNQYLATKKVGSQSPFFAQQNKTNPIKTEQLAFDPEINIFKVWQDFATDEATRRSGFDYKVLTEFAPTDGQQKSRKFETDKTNRNVLMVNNVTDKEFAEQTIYMLKAGDSEFHQKDLYLKVGDWFYENMPDEDKEGMKNEAGRYKRVPMKIGEFLEEYPNTEFSLTPRLDGVLDDAAFFEMQDARQDLALITPGTPAANKLSEHYFMNKYGGVQFNRGDFALAAPEAPQAAPVNPEDATVV